jgi:hypothetical protein
MVKSEDNGTCEVASGSLIATGRIPFLAESQGSGGPLYNDPKRYQSHYKIFEGRLRGASLIKGIPEGKNDSAQAFENCSKTKEQQYSQTHSYDGEDIPQNKFIHEQKTPNFHFPLGSLSQYTNNNTDLQLLGAIPQNRYYNQLNNRSGMSKETSYMDRRRHVHNVCEKKRREHIKEGFILLQQRVPKKYPHCKMSKLDVLKGSIQQVYDLKNVISDLEIEIETLFKKYILECEKNGHDIPTEVLSKFEMQIPQT